MKKKIARELSSEEILNLYDINYVKRFEKNTSLTRIKLLFKFIPLSKKDIVADFGCGNGMILRYIHSSIKFYYGIDFSEFFIEKGNNFVKKARIRNAQFILSKINTFCQTNQNKFTIVFLFDVTEHIYDSKLIDILKSIRLSLKKNGVLYIHSPNADFIIEQMKSKNFILKQFKEHIAVRNSKQMAMLFKEAGYSDIDIKAIPHYNFLKYIHVLSYLPFIGYLFKARLFIMARK